MKASALLLWIAAGSLLGLLLLGILAFASVGDGASDDNRRDQNASEVTVEVFDNGYAPNHLTVRPGTTITWDFTGELPHTVTEPGGLFDSGPVRTGQQWTMDFDEPGEYYYFCLLHHAMEARIIVQP
jgi:plastocyanin